MLLKLLLKAKPPLKHRQKLSPFMRPEDCFYLGRITKVFGLKGELSVYLDTDEPEKYYQLESVFLFQEEELVPFFITSVKVRTRQHVILQFQGVDAGAAPDLVGAEMYLPLDMLPPLSGNRFYYHEVKGFEIVDDGNVPIGTCMEVLEYPHQALFRVDHDGTEVLLPVVDEFIREVDREGRRIAVSLPDGLLDIYLHPEAD